MTLQEDYQVTIDAFQGPLDLLLFLIRRAEVDIHDIPIAVITDQYLAFLRSFDIIDIDLAGEFLVMAASLIELKSRTLVPPSDEDEAGEGGGDRPGSGEDPRFELVQALLAYQRFRTASEDLESHRQSFLKMYPLRSARQNGLAAMESAEPVELELDDVHALDLSEAYERIIASIDFTRIGDHHVEMDDTPIALYEEDLLDRLERANEGRITLQRAFDGLGRPQRIGLFLATLELVRLRRVTVAQDDIDSEIELVLLDEEEALVIETDAINEHHHHHGHDHVDAHGLEAEHAPVEGADAG